MYVLPELNYQYGDIEPYIDEETMKIHHGKHHQGYTNKLNLALKTYNLDAETSIEDIIKNISLYNESVRNNAGGFYNHSLFWTNIAPNGSNVPTKILLESLEHEFGSKENFVEEFKNLAASHFGSGWIWLSVNSNTKLFLSSTPNQDNPLMDVVSEQGIPILGLDVWEHAYYLKYQNNRAAYVDAFFEIINWDEISRRYAVAI